MCRLCESPGSGDAQSPGRSARSTRTCRGRSRPDWKPSSPQSRGRSQRFAETTQGASMTTTTSDSTTTETEDRLAILELIGRLSLTIDAKDWDAMGQLFTDTVYHDRTSLTGGEPYTAPVAQFVEGGRQTLPPMDAVHHQ